MKRFILKTLKDLDDAFYKIRAEMGRGEPLSLVMDDYEESRRGAQNNLAFFLYKQLSIVMEDGTPEDKRAFCKLHYGVPIRREEEKYRQQYDEHIRPLSYEAKISIMVGAIDFPVTRGMSVKQMHRYLEAIYDESAKVGIVLPKPEDNYYLAMGIKRK